MPPTSRRVVFAAAAALGVAPLAFGLLRAWTAGGDYGMFWMALASSFFAAAIMAPAMGHRRSRRAVRVQAAWIVVVATLLSAGAGYVFGATATAGIWAVSVVFGVCLATASVLVAMARSGAH